MSVRIVTGMSVVSYVTTVMVTRLCHHSDPASMDRVFLDHLFTVLRLLAVCTNKQLKSQFSPAGSGAISMWDREGEGGLMKDRVRVGNLLIKSMYRCLIQRRTRGDRGGLNKESICNQSNTQ